MRDLKEGFTTIADEHGPSPPCSDMTRMAINPADFGE
jgi:hypothetical protein